MFFEVKIKLTFIRITKQEVLDQNTPLLMTLIQFQNFLRTNQIVNHFITFVMLFIKVNILFILRNSNLTKNAGL